MSDPLSTQELLAAKDVIIGQQRKLIDTLLAELRMRENQPVVVPHYPMPSPTFPYNPILCSDKTTAGVTP